jgi:hypothetical protein
LARSEAGGLLADVVAATGYAVRGGALADDLRRYKSERGGAEETAAAAARLRERLAAFLADHGRAVWDAAEMPSGPAAVAVVPSGQGRPGAHPLVSLVRSCVELPWLRLAVAAPEVHTRGVNPGWARVVGRMDGGGVLAVDSGGVLAVDSGGVLAAGDCGGLMVAGADVLVVDDTWVSGGSAQSVAAALRLAGARRVAVVVLGRHVNPADPRSAAFLAAVRKDFPAGCPPVPDRFVLRAGQ